MLNGLYHVIVIAVAVWAVISGYRKGLVRQTGSLMAVTFGIVGTRLMAPDFAPSVDDFLPGFISGFKRQFIVETLACTVIYVLVTGLMELIALPLSKLMKVVTTGIINSIGGAVFRLFQYLMLLSLFYNLIVDFNPSGTLTRSSRLHDGNILEVTMKIAPAILGFPGAEEVAHYQQLEDAKKIS